MTLFTKEGCEKCEYVKRTIDLEHLGVREQQLNGENYQALAELAYYGLVEKAQKTLPILVTEDNQVVVHAGRIKSYLQRQARA
ncbi:MAG: hypothetical protein GXP49_00490 [Deltaproteobacteria bacterium]|nr:hypothetical protein [Deltaproteobacteria bacterium]